MGEDLTLPGGEGAMTTWRRGHAALAMLDHAFIAIATGATPSSDPEASALEVLRSRLLVVLTMAQARPVLAEYRARLALAAYAEGIPELAAPPTQSRPRPTWVSEAPDVPHAERVTIQSIEPAGQRTAPAAADELDIETVLETAGKVGRRVRGPLNRSLFVLFLLVDIVVLAVIAVLVLSVPE